MENACGDFFAFVDSDDIVGIDLYRVMIEKALDSSADIVAADVLEVWDNNSLVSTKGTLCGKNWDLHGNEIVDTLFWQKGFDYMWQTVWNKVYSIEIWKHAKKMLKMQSKYLMMCEDIAFSCAFFSVANHFVNVHHNYYYYFKRNTSDTMKKQTYSSFLQNIEYIKIVYDFTKKVLQETNNWNVNAKNHQQFFNTIYESWEWKLANDCDFKIFERAKISKILDRLIIDRETDACNRDRCFASLPV